MSTDGIQTVGFKRLIFLDDKVRRVTLETLREGTVIGKFGRKVWRGEEVISKRVLGGKSTTTGRRGEEEVNVRYAKTGKRHTGRSDEDEVHDITTILINVQFIQSGSIEACRHHAADAITATQSRRGKSKDGSCGKDGGGERK